MNIVVCAKQVVDVGEIKVNPSTNKPVLEGIPRKISDIDKNAMEEAIRIKEKLGGKITAMTVGPPDARERIKELLAMGADEGVLIEAPENADYHLVSRALARGIEKMGDVDIVLCGEASIDMFSGQVGPRIAGHLRIPQLTYAFRLEADEGKIRADRNMGDTMVISESTYPVVVTVTKEINEPRLPSLMQILGSANKPLNEWKMGDLGLEGEAPRVTEVDLSGVSMERKNVIFKDDLDEAVNELADRLAKEGVTG
ncbi:MAG TPA: electron transfer flavoprotein beta subunit/FixA family protein [Euryarchaeota archaeon]|nr:MAG: electron transfer flavoprotein subunit beta [Thermoplasmatales archaeon ex4484_6]RLF66546.1 MAG: electron transfer flavoprotein subunit beta [Thermoplasmata archaeon]HHD16732.1 electron transfer flavoprotein beta subunit/FixA family protein [Euryarchaeota archaeon]